MSSEQTTLGASNGGIAEELAEDQQSISVAEFFDKNKHMLGFDSKSRAIVTAIKEAVDNSLDASEEAGILPEINIEIEETTDYYRVVVEDNGPGITTDEVPKIFGQLLYGSRFHKNAQTRGQQGLGISAAVLYSQKTSGRSAIVRTKTGENTQASEFAVKVDTETNRAEVENETEIEWNSKDHGTRIELTMDANMRARKQLHRYIKDTALVNPHARITVEEPKWSFESERATDQLPPQPEEIQPHPHGIEIGTLTQMLSTTNEDTLMKFLQNDFTRVGKKTAQNIIELAERHYRDTYTGRSLAWKVDKLTISTEETENEDEEPEQLYDSVEEELRDVVYSSINRKSPDAKEALTDCIVESILDNGTVSYMFLSETVLNCSREVERSYDERVGSAVQDAITEQTWDYIQSNRVNQLFMMLNDVTSKRKTQDSLQVFADVFNKILQSTSPKEVITEDELRNAISKSADETESETGTSFGDTSITNIFSAFWEQADESNEELPEVDTILSDDNAIKSLNTGMKEAKVMAPSTKCLSPITPDLMEAGLQEMFPEAEMYATEQLDGEVRKGSPFIVEAGVAYGKDIQSSEEQIDLRRFANRVPLVYQQGACATTKVTKNIGWRNYKLKQTGGEGAMPRGPMVLMVHVASTNVPFTSESKDAIAPDDDVIEDEIERAIRRVARDVKSFTKEQERLQDLQEKRENVGRILPPLTDSFANVAETESPDPNPSMARIMNNLLIDASGSSLTLTNFLPSSVEISIESGETYTVSLDKDETKTIDIESADSFHVSGIEPERVTLTDNVSPSLETVLSKS